MDDVAANKSGTIQRQQLVGPPLLAKVAAVIGLLIAIAGLVTLDVLLLSLGLVGAVAAFKLLRLGVLVEGEEVVLRNLFYTKRLDLQTTFLHRGKTDLRLREESGVRPFPGGFVPRAADDNTAYDAKVIKLSNSSTNDTYVIDASFGLTPPKQAKLFDSLETTLEAAKNF